MKLKDIPKTWRHTAPGIWHQPRTELKWQSAKKLVKKFYDVWAIYYEQRCARCNEKYVTAIKKRPYCGNICANNAIKKFGEDHPRWKNGRCEVVGGYILKRESGSKEGYQQEHRIVMGKHLGRKLLTTEIVHHINENKWDNRIENLQIMSRSEHAKHHRLHKDDQKQEN